MFVGQPNKLKRALSISSDDESARASRKRPVFSVNSVGDQQNSSRSSGRVRVLILNPECEMTGTNTNGPVTYNPVVHYYSPNAPDQLSSNMEVVSDEPDVIMIIRTEDFNTNEAMTQVVGHDHLAALKARLFFLSNCPIEQGQLITVEQDDQILEGAIAYNRHTTKVSQVDAPICIPVKESEEPSEPGDESPDESEEKTTNVDLNKSAIDILLEDSFWGELSKKRNAALWRAEEDERVRRRDLGLGDEFDLDRSTSEDESSDSDSPVVVREVDNERLKAKFPTTNYAGAGITSGVEFKLTAYAEYAGRRDARIATYLQYKAENPEGIAITLREADELHLFKRNIIQRVFGSEQQNTNGGTASAKPPTTTDIVPEDAGTGSNRGSPQRLRMLSRWRGGAKAPWKPRRKYRVTESDDEAVPTKPRITLSLRKNPKPNHFPDDALLAERFYNEPGFIPAWDSPLFNGPRIMRFLPLHSDYSNIVVYLFEIGYDLNQLTWLLGPQSLSPGGIQLVTNLVRGRIDRYYKVIDKAKAKEIKEAGSVDVVRPSKT